jgi:transcriptional regulator with XRE-family HTH domain
MPVVTDVEAIQAEVAGGLGEFIRQQRERADLSLRRLADRAGISNPYLSQIERGVKRPSAQILKQLSRALQISAETLYSRAGWMEDGMTTTTVIEAIDADPHLSARHKQVMRDLYRSLVAAGDLVATDYQRKENENGS